MDGSGETIFATQFFKFSNSNFSQKMNRESIIGLAIAAATLWFVLIFTKKEDTLATAEIEANFLANFGTPRLDGSATDEVWQQTEWRPLDQNWIGKMPTPEDFTGKYKLAWDENFLYVLAEIQDDTLIDIHPDGLEKYWDDDCLEIFVDEDASGGNHQYNYNAFAYHIALDGKVVDVNPKQEFAYFNDHCTSIRKTAGKTTVWEVAVRIFDGKKYVDGGENYPKLLRQGKTMGFALAYCDNDHSAERENFMGSVVVEGEDKNRGWIDASIFGKLILK